MANNEDNLLRIGIFQPNIVWADIEKNHEKTESLISSLNGLPDLLVLPEMYSTGFLQNPGIVPDKLLKKQFNWQASISKRNSMAVCGSIIEKFRGQYYNRWYITYPDGKLGYYDKRHLFEIGGEGEWFSKGKKRVVFSMGQWILMPQICYDLRFPVWSRNNLGYNMLIYSANWPASRIEAWETLLKARAIENQCYVVGVNRTGTDGNAVEYNGNSAVYGPDGKTIVHLGNQEIYATAELSLDKLINFRKSFPALSDADKFKINTREQ
ncbi:MAG: nitrilase family protein [Bacteroidales bacterium]|nr:nitrilase family protein [Bacteroidales bacterium]